MTLRERIIRLAAARPELQETLLPILTASTGQIISPDHHMTDPETGKYLWTVERVKAAWARSMTDLEQTLQGGGVSKVVLMVGIPASGKTTWLSRHSEPGVLYFDATFKDQRARKPIIDIAQKYAVPVEAVVMVTPLDEVTRRNNTRSPDRRVPDEVLGRMYNDLTGRGFPTRQEGLQHIRMVHPTV